MDFSEILDSWENRSQRRDREPYEKDHDRPGAADLPTKLEMERARVEEELDLHGMVQEEALAALRFFLRESRTEGLRKVLVIHGKGLHSENRKAVLRNAVRQVLIKDRNVAAWGEAAKKDGGQGASWVWLSVRGK